MIQQLVVLPACAPHHVEERFISRPCEAVRRYICDCCDAQSRCHEHFGNGATCPIVEHGHVWMRLTLPLEMPQSKRPVPEFVRVSGLCVCQGCGKQYYDHPSAR